MRASSLSWIVVGALVVACDGRDGDATIASELATKPSARTKGSTDRDGAFGFGSAPSRSGPVGSADDGPPPNPYVPFDINHVLETGQSNSVANNSYPVQSSVQPYENLMFDVGVIAASQCDGNGCTGYDKPTSFVPLVEGDRYFPADTEGRETMTSGLANQITAFAHDVQNGANHTVLASLHGRSGNSYFCLRKGGCNWWLEKNYVRPFDDGMRQVEDAKAIADAAGKSYVVRVVTAIHGETDHYSRNFPHAGSDGTPEKIQNYADALVEWQGDYDTEIKARTGQTIDVPLLISQMNDWNNVTDSSIPLDQYAAHVRAPGKVVLVGPTYMLPFQKDCLHFTAQSERRLGEYFAKAYSRIVLEGRTWEPLRPKSITRAGNVITVSYFVPKPPLVLDTTNVTDPGNYGFELRDGLGTQISSVELSGSDSVKITLSGEPSSNALLRYAASAVPSTCPGPTRGPRGNLRDSDGTLSRTGNDLPNWSVAYQIPVQ